MYPNSNKATMRMYMIGSPFRAIESRCDTATTLRFNGVGEMLNLL
jgi:hypothetical protein